MFIALAEDVFKKGLRRPLQKRVNTMTIERQIHLYPSSPRRSIKRILCPIDLSPESDQGLRYSMALARVYRAKLYICHCVSEITPDCERHLTEKIKEVVTSFVGTHVSTVPDWEGIVIKGRPSEEITRVASRYQVDLIVINSKRRAYSTKLLGSVAEAICHTAPCPVLVTHSDERDWVDASGISINIKKLLVAYDYSDQADWAFSYALSLAEEHNAELHLLNVVPIHPENLCDKEAILRRAIQRMKNAVPKEADYSCSKIKWVVKEGLPYSEILLYAKENGIDLICMGAQGSGYEEWTLLGSNADRVVRHAPCPVLIAHPFKWYAEKAVDQFFQFEIVPNPPDDLAIPKAKAKAKAKAMVNTDNK
jgi:nucleotide-binding universal stress UspA family protein